MALYLDSTPKDINASNLVCDSSDAILRTLYIISLVVVSVTFGLQMRLITKKKQILKLIPLIGAWSCLAISSIIRLVDIDRGLGQDPTFTFFYAVGWLLSNVASLIFFNRFIRYQANANEKYNINSSTNHKFSLKTDVLVKMQSIILLIDLIHAVLLITSGFVESYVIDRKLIFAALGLYVFRNMYALWADIYYVGLVLKDCRQLLAVDQDSSASLPKFRVNDLQTHLKTNVIPGLEKLRVSITCFSVFYLWICFSPLVWNLWLNAWKYLIPVQFIYGCVMNSFVVFYSNKAKGRNASSKNTASKYLSTDGQESARDLTLYAQSSARSV